MTWAGEHRKLFVNTLAVCFSETFQEIVDQLTIFKVKPWMKLMCASLVKTGYYYSEGRIKRVPFEKVAISSTLFFKEKTEFPLQVSFFQFIERL